METSEVYRLLEAMRLQTRLQMTVASLDTSGVWRTGLLKALSDRSYAARDRKVPGTHELVASVF